MPNQHYWTSPLELAPLIEQHGPPEHLLRKTGSNFATLAKAIAFQASWGAVRARSGTRTA